jgi:hypothetical protein
LAKRLAPDKIRVNTICPGPIDTPILRVFVARPDQQSSTQDKEEAARWPMILTQTTASAKSAKPGPVVHILPSLKSVARLEWRDERTCAARPGLDRALNALKRGDILVVRKLNRLGRSLSDLVQIIAELGERGVNFLSLIPSTLGAPGAA